MIRTSPSAFASFPRAAVTLALCSLLGVEVRPGSDPF